MLAGFLPATADAGCSQATGSTLLMLAISTEGPTIREVPLSAMAWQPPWHTPMVPGTLMASRSNCQYAGLVTLALHGAARVHQGLVEKKQLMQRGLSLLSQPEDQSQELWQDS